MEDAALSILRSGVIAGPVSPLMIANAQEALGVAFPTEYTEFLREFGSVLFDGCELYGMSVQNEDGPPLWQDVVVATKDFREQKGLTCNDQYLIPISDDGMDCTFFLNTMKSPKTEIVAWGPGVNKCVAKSLSEFIIGVAGDTLSL